MRRQNFDARVLFLVMASALSLGAGTCSGESSDSEVCISSLIQMKSCGKVPADFPQFTRCRDMRTLEEAPPLPDIGSFTDEFGLGTSPMPQLPPPGTEVDIKVKEEAVWCVDEITRLKTCLSERSKQVYACYEEGTAKGGKISSACCDLCEAQKLTFKRCLDGVPEYLDPAPKDGSGHSRSASDSDLHVPPPQTAPATGGGGSPKGAAIALPAN